MTEPNSEPQKTTPPEETPPTMTSETPAFPAAESAPDPVPAPAGPPARARRRLSLVGPLAAAGFVVLAVGGAWLWQQQQNLAAQLARPVPPAPSAEAARVTALEAQVATLAQRLAQAEQRPAPAPAASPVDLGPVQARLSALAGRLDALQGSGAGAEQMVDGKLQAVEGKLQAMEQRLATSEQREQAALSRVARAAAVAGAAQSLAAGRPLGEIPGAPPALSRFATAAPPTEAALRLAFPAAAEAAEQTSLPTGAGLSFAARVWQRAQGLVTVRQGEQVLIGAPAARVLAQARERLDAGDLAGTLAVLEQLDPAAAKAMAGWRAQAQSLLDARAALAAMAQP